MEHSFVIDCFPESAAFYRSGYAIVVVDVIRATTMAVTAVALGRCCFPVTTVEEAFELARRLKNPILAGELAGDMPAGFEMSNSPAELVLRSDTHRPIVLLSSSGTQLIAQASGADAVYLSCFRNFTATARYLCGNGRPAGPRHSKVAIIGAGSRGEFREEDQMGCAWVAQTMMQAGYRPWNHATEEIVERWRGADPSACAQGNSAKYLHRSGQSRDLDFILEKIDDINAVFTIRGEEVVVAPPDRCAASLPNLSAFPDATVYDAR